jgi:site-specific recombinase XerD
MSDICRIRPSFKSRTALTTVYAAGLLVSEVVLLKIADIDSQRMANRVEQGKGGKDRYVMLCPQLLTHLLAARSSEAMAVSWPRRRASARTQRLVRGLSFSLPGG